MNKWLFRVIFLLLPLQVTGKWYPESTGDSLRYLTPQDTIFLTTGLCAQKFFTHTMEPGQTLYSLSRFYGLTLEELYFYNPDYEGGKYDIGSQIKIPVPNRSILRYPPDDFDPSQYVPIFYIVQKGETIFNVAHRIFKLPIDTILDRNHMLTPTLFIGQKLHVGWMSIEGIPDNYRQFKGHPLWKKSYNFRQKYVNEKNAGKEHRKKGAAVYIKGNKSTADLLVMHRHAPVGSVMEITNPMKSRTVYAKVVAKIPRTYAPNIEVVVSPGVGKLLGARDDKFYVKTRYLR